MDCLIQLDFECIRRRGRVDDGSGEHDEEDVGQLVEKELAEDLQLHVALCLLVLDIGGRGAGLRETKRFSTTTGSSAPMIASS